MADVEKHSPGSSRLVLSSRIRARIAWVLSFFIMAFFAIPPILPSPEVAVKSFRVVDNGDGDGFPDTNETVELFVTVRNPTQLQDLTNVVIELTSSGPKTDARTDCIIPFPSSVTISSLPAGAEVEIPTPFRLHVSPDADRGSAAVRCNNPGPSGTCSNFVDVPGGCFGDSDCHRTALQDYSVSFGVSITSDQYPAPGARPQKITLDLDLNSSHPSASTGMFVEGFEAGIGSFTFENLDANKASNSASDGYRCQYNDPDFPGSHSYGVTECYLGFAAGQNPMNDWHVHSTIHPDGGRAFEETRSLHYGKHTVGFPALDTYGLSQLDGIRTKSGINLAARVCRDDLAADKRSCGSAADCLTVGGGPCVAASPVLSFKHQVSLVDGRAVSPPGQTEDRGVVHARLAGSTIWRKLHPFENIYDVQAEDFFSECKFDPVDDGNNEDSYFDPTDPFRLYGPSSTCFPEFVFSYLGDTDEPFDSARIGSASDGPGLQGSLGVGTWVESRFDLSRFRGRSIEIRFLFTSVKAGDSESWQSLAMWNPIAYDDGWYIDDIRVTQTLGTTSPTVNIDNADNSGLLPGNIDGDARGDECDCAPADPGAFAIPDEVRNLRLTANKVTLTWESVVPRAGSNTVHDVVRGALGEFPVGSGPSEICLAPGNPNATASDFAMPAARNGFWYAVRARNVCASGTYGFQSNGIERTSSACP